MSQNEVELKKGTFPLRVCIHDLQITDSAFHVTLINEPYGTLTFYLNFVRILDVTCISVF